MINQFPQELQNRLTTQIETYRQETLLKAQNPTITTDDIARAQTLWQEANKHERAEIRDLLN